MAILGADIKACTSLLTGRRGYRDGYGVDDHNRSGVKWVSYTPTAAANMINVTGRGIWTFGYFQGYGDGSSTNTVVVTIDGVVVSSDTNSANIQYTGMCQVGSIYVAGNVVAGVSREFIPFNKSLLVNVQSDADSRYYYDYYLT
jgi:hypothetical protein